MHQYYILLYMKMYMILVCKVVRQFWEVICVPQDKENTIVSLWETPFESTPTYIYARVWKGGKTMILKVM